MALPMQKAARGKRPQYFADPSIDRCLSMVMALSEEVWVMRERMAAMEALLERNAPVSSKTLDSYEPGIEEAVDNAKRREVFLDCVLRSVQQEVERLQLQGDGAAMEDVIADVAIRT